MINTHDTSIAILGAGFSGLGMGILLKEAGLNQFVIFEKASDVGGTWRDNTYPGCAVDIAVPLYCYSFELNSEWSRSFAEQKEILGYIKHCVNKYNLTDYIKLNCEIVEARFSEKIKKWLLKDRLGNKYQFNFLISAVGALHQPQLPEICGLDNFEGDSFHSASWNHEVNLENKNVGIIGNGCSAVQIIPQIASNVKQLTLFFRSPKWVAPKELIDKEYSNIKRWIYRRIPYSMKMARFGWFIYQELLYQATRKNSIFSKIAQKFLTYDMTKKIHDDDRQKLLIPDYDPFCSRITPSSNYLQTLERPNVKIVSEKIQGVEGKGIRTTDKTFHKIDILIYATGFNVVNPFGNLKIYGKNNIEIMGNFIPKPQIYYGVTIPNFPNFFMFLGPNTALTHNSVLIMIESQIKYAIDIIKNMIKSDKTCFEVKGESTKEYVERLHQDFNGSVWYEACNTFYRNKQGDIIGLWPKSAYAYMKAMRHPKYSDYNFL